jgi:hypothetical protein
MIPINNSDTAWLIVSDYNQDNAIGYPDELREDVLNPNVNDWDNRLIQDDGGTDVGARGRISGVGGNHSVIFYTGGDNVGNQHVLSDLVGGAMIYLSRMVGGHEYDPDQH